METQLRLSGNDSRFIKRSVCYLRVKHKCFFFILYCVHPKQLTTIVITPVYRIGLGQKQNTRVTRKCLMVVFTKPYLNPTSVSFEIFINHYMSHFITAFFLLHFCGLKLSICSLFNLFTSKLDYRTTNWNPKLKIGVLSLRLRAKRRFHHAHTPTDFFSQKEHWDRKREQSVSCWV